MARTPRESVSCSFCGKRQDQVGRLIAGPDKVFICDECVHLYTAMMAETPDKPSPPNGVRVIGPGRGGGDR